jgi:hypothetical protein
MHERTISMHNLIFIFENESFFVFSHRCAIRFHGNEQLVNGPRFHMMLELDQKLYYIAKLEIRGVQATDKGEYRAIATNKHGESVATINLNFDNAAGGAPK